MSLDIPAVLRHAEGAPGPLSLATVVGTRGPCYRKVGARMLVSTSRGRIAGRVSAGCLERHLVQRIGWLAQAGPRVQTYDSTLDADDPTAGFGLGCGGSIDVLLQNLGPDTPVLDVLRWVAARTQDAAIVTVTQTAPGGPPVGACFAATASGRDSEHPWSPACSRAIAQCLRSRTHQQVHAEPGWHAVVEYVPPPRDLLVAATHDDALPLVQLAPTLGWCVTVAHPRERLGNTPARSLSPTTLQDWRRAHPHGAAVLMTHNPALDRLGLQQLASGFPALPYVGVLGPRARTLALAKDAGLSDAETARLHAPVGLPLGGEGPAAIALSIVAQLEQLTSGHKP